MCDCVFLEERLNPSKSFRLDLIPLKSSLNVHVHTYVCDCPTHTTSIKRLSMFTFVTYMLPSQHCLNTATSVLCSFALWYCHPYVPVHILKIIFTLASLGFCTCSICTLAQWNNIACSESTVENAQVLRHYVTHNVMCYNTRKWLLMFVWCWKPQLPPSRIGKVRTFW